MKSGESKFRELALIALIAAWASVMAVGQCAKGAAEKPKAATAGAMKYWNTDQGKWEDSASMPGLHSMTVSGDPAKGAAVIYLKFDPNTKVPWHWHPGPEIVNGNGG